jgi:hypothetical protein
VVQNRNGGRIIGEQMSSLAKFIVTDWGDKDDHGIGLSYRPAAGLHRLAGRYGNPDGVNFIPPSGTMNLAPGKEVDEEVPLGGVRRRKWTTKSNYLSLY